MPQLGEPNPSRLQPSHNHHQVNPYTALMSETLTPNQVMAEWGRIEFGVHGLCKPSGWGPSPKPLAPSSRRVRRRRRRGEGGDSVGWEGRDSSCTLQLGSGGGGTVPRLLPIVVHGTWGNSRARVRRRGRNGLVIGLGFGVEHFKDTSTQRLL